MKLPSDDDLIASLAGQPAPLLPLLHAFHERDGRVTDEAISAIGRVLGKPLADLYGTVTFYHHLSRDPGGREKPRICTGPVCAMRGSEGLLAKLKEEGARAMPCAGRCDQPIPVLRGDRTFVGDAGGGMVESPLSPLPAENPALARGERLGAFEECVFMDLRKPGQATLEGYRAHGGFEGLEKALAASPREVLRWIAESGLAGRGGAGFPTGQKWRAVAEAEGAPKTIVCNADEGEPGCFKDRAVLDHDPFAVIEGMLIAAHATGASRGFVYLRYEYPETSMRLRAAIADAYGEGLLGADALGEGRPFDLWLRRGAGAYICGEEGSLLNSLEGRHPFPRNRPPFPVTHGFENLPTAVNNVETLASVPRIVRLGAEWYRGLGLSGLPGTKLISLSGDIQRPGNYEIPFGLPLRTLLEDWAGGAPGGRSIQAVTMAGLSGGFLAGEDLDVALDEASIRAKGSFLGAGGIIVFDSSRDMVEAAAMAMEFFAGESCGKCFPCRIGTQRLKERLAREAGPTDYATWEAEVKDLCEVMKSASACGLGIAAPLVAESLLRYFAPKVEAALARAGGGS
ncbi:MAG: NAD(P)H-dependent oxidoreductase subunit E [Planctomycetota bacterium]